VYSGALAYGINTGIDPANSNHLIYSMIANVQLNTGTNVCTSSLLIALTAVTLAVAACSSPQPSQKPAGWQLVAQKPNGAWPSLRVTPVSDTAVSVVLVVSPGCPDNGQATPSFAGFAIKGDIIEAIVSRTPITSPGPCVASVGVEFDVELDLRTFPSSTRTVTLGGQACPTGDDSCATVVVPMPVQGLASPPG
jgi:hypothetical protein